MKLWKTLLAKARAAIEIAVQISVMTAGLLAVMYVVLIRPADVLEAQSTVETRTTVFGCGQGLTADGTGSYLVQWFSEVNIWRPTSGLVPRHSWLTAVNPTSEEQMITVTALEEPAGLTVRAFGYRIPARSRRAINLGDWFWPGRPRVDVALEVVWQTYGSATVAIWNADYSAQVIVPATSGCFEAWRSPYGNNTSGAK